MILIFVFILLECGHFSSARQGFIFGGQSEENHETLELWGWTSCWHVRMKGSFLAICEREKVLICLDFKYFPSEVHNNYTKFSCNFIPFYWIKLTITH